MINQTDYQRLFGPYHLLHPYGGNPFSYKRRQAKAGSYKDQDFPEYLVDVTRNSLVTVTDSVSQASSQSYFFFSQLCQYYALERFARQYDVFGIMPASQMNGFGNTILWALPPLAQQATKAAAFHIDRFSKKSHTRPSALTAASAPPSAGGRPAEDTFAAACAAFTALSSAFMAMTPSAVQSSNMVA